MLRSITVLSINNLLNDVYDGLMDSGIAVAVDVTR